jgi:hypothetical protein
MMNQESQWFRSATMEQSSIVHLRDKNIMRNLCEVYLRMSTGYMQRKSIDGLPCESPAVDSYTQQPVVGQKRPRES